MHLFFKRVALVTAVAVAVLSAGCDIGAGKPAKSPAPAILGASTVSEAAADLGIPALKGKELTVRYRFQAGGNFLVLTAPGESLAVTGPDIESAARAYLNLLPTTREVTLTRSGQSVKVVADLRVRPAKAVRWAVYVSDEDSKAFKTGHPELGTGENSFTLFGNIYIASFLAQVKGDEIALTPPIPGIVRSTYVELCQSLVYVTLPEKERAKLQGKIWNGQQENAELAVQEMVCNGFGWATAVARHEPPVDNPTYQAEVAKRPRLQGPGGIAIYLMAVDEATYNRFAKR